MLALSSAGHLPATATTKAATKAATKATTGRVAPASGTDDIKQVADDDDSLAVGLDEIVARRAWSCSAAVGRLGDLLAPVRDGVRFRGRLQRLDPDVLRAGRELWLARRASRRPERSDDAAH